MDDKDRRRIVREMLRRDEENMALTPSLRDAHRAVIADSWRSVLAEDSCQDTEDMEPTEATSGAFEAAASEQKATSTVLFDKWKALTGIVRLTSASILQEIGPTNDAIAAAYADAGTQIPTTSLWTAADGSSDPLRIVIQGIPPALTHGACVLVPLDSEGTFHFLIPQIAGVGSADHFALSSFLEDGIFEVIVHLPDVPGRYVVVAIFGLFDVAAKLLALHDEIGQDVAALDRLFTSLSLTARSGKSIVAWSVSDALELNRIG